MPLRRCTGLYGTTTLIGHDPMLETYTDVLCVPHGTEGASAGLYDRGRKLVTASGSFRASPDPVAAEAPTTPLDATRFDHADDAFDYLFLGTLTGHFGHFILSSMARLWPMRFAPDPRLRCVVLNPAPLDPLFELGFLRDILAPLGLTPDNVVGFDAPTRLRRIVVPSPAIEEQNFSHPVFARLCNRIGALLAAPLPPVADDVPVFLSKMRLGDGVSRLVNEAAFCERLERHGVRIVVPEQLAFPGQVRLFRDTAAITGMAGSAMHTAAFAPGRPMLALSLTPTPLSNQRLLDRANGGLTLALHPDGDLLPEPVPAGFHHAFRLRDPARTADEFLAEIEATLRPAIAARRTAREGDTPRNGTTRDGTTHGGAAPDGHAPGAGRVLFEHVFSREPPILTAGEDGWSEPEDSHVWTLGPHSTLTLPRPDTDGPVRLELVLGSTFLPPHLRSRPIAVSVDGLEVGRFTVDRTALYACTLPAACLAAPTLALRFSHPVTASPHDLGLNADIRPISIAFSAIRLREPDDP